MTVEVNQLQVYKRVVKVTIQKKGSWGCSMEQGVQMTVEVNQLQHYKRVFEVIVQKEGEVLFMEQVVQMTV